MAVNEPDGVVCVWNLHSPNAPEFVLHAQVRSRSRERFVLSYHQLISLPSTVRCPLCCILSIPPQYYYRRNVFWTNSVMGHAISKSQSDATNTTVSGRTHTSDLCSDCRWVAKRSQYCVGFDGWYSLRMDRRYVGEAAGDARTGSSGAQ